MSGRASPTARITIDQITAERVALHHHIPPLGENTPIPVDPLPVDYSVPIEENIEWAVRRLRDNCSGSPSIIRVEHLQQWLWEVRKSEEDTVAVTGATKEADTETVKEAETEMDTGEGGGADAGGLIRGLDVGGVHLAEGDTTPQGGEETTMVLAWCR